jgi:hypothetical protein
MRFDQGELAYDENDQPWARRFKEPAHAWNAFRLYRDLGPMRTMANAYDAYLIERGSRPDAESRGRNSGVSRAWARWRKEWSWDERCQAFDRCREERERKALEQAAQEALERKAERKVEEEEKLFRDYQCVSEQIRSFLASGLMRVEKRQRDDDSTVISETDPVKAMPGLTAERWALWDRYFGPAATDGGDKPTETIVNGVFRWVPDPDMAEVPEDQPAEVPPDSEHSGGSKKNEE